LSSFLKLSAHVSKCGLIFCFFVCLLVHQTVMPCPSKASARAKAKQQAGQSMFVPAKAVSSSDESMYDSGEEVLSAAESDAEEEDESPENIVSLQRLHAVFLPLHLKQHSLPQAKKQWGAN
jgi:hypothetical protein